MCKLKHITNKECMNKFGVPRNYLKAMGQLAEAILICQKCGMALTDDNHAECPNCHQVCCCTCLDDGCPNCGVAPNVDANGKVLKDHLNSKREQPISALLLNDMIDAPITTNMIPPKYQDTIHEVAVKHKGDLLILRIDVLLPADEMHQLRRELIEACKPAGVYIVLLTPGMELADGKGLSKGAEER